MNAIARPVAGPVSWTSSMMIDDELVGGRGAAISVDNPATEEILAELQAASSEQVDQAVVSARRALDEPTWQDPEARRAALLLIARVLEEHKDTFIRAIVNEVGTPVQLAQALQIDEPIAILRTFAEMTARDWSRRLGVVEQPLRSDAVVRYQPVGVVAAIAAYNYPLLFAACKIGAAFAAGCTVVLLPSPQAPLSILLLGELLAKAGLPSGVLNVVVGDATTGRLLTTHPGVDKISFTGSLHVGREVMAQAAPGLKRIVLELGGKSPSLLLPDVDVAAIAEQVHARYVRNAGQGCSSPTRILVHEDRYLDFVDKSREVIGTMMVGDPWRDDVVAGPLISSSHRARVEGFVERAVGEGGTVLAGGGRPDLELGYFMNPALVGNVDNSAEIAQEELFGPVGVVLPYRTLDEAISIANDSKYGLAATIYGDVDQALEIAPRLRVGTVMVNGWVPRRDQVSGGFKMSGIGREMGDDGIKEFLEAQFIAWPLDDRGA